MGATTYSRCARFVDNMKSHGRKKIDTYTLMGLITKFIGSDPRTVLRALNLMVSSGLITPKEGVYILNGESDIQKRQRQRIQSMQKVQKA